MGNIIEWLFENLLELMPFTVVNSYERGVRWVCGKNPGPLDPGVRRKIWFVDHVQTVDVREDYFDLEEQTLTTKDGKAIVFSATVGYRIIDPVKHLCEVSDFRTASISIAMAHLAERVRDQNYSALGNLKALERSLKSTLETRVKDWGTEILRVSFLNFVLVPRQLRIWGNVASGTAANAD